MMDLFRLIWIRRAGSADHANGLHSWRYGGASVGPSCHLNGRGVAGTLRVPSASYGTRSVPATSTPVPGCAGRVQIRLCRLVSPGVAPGKDVSAALGTLVRLL